MPPDGAPRLVEVTEGTTNLLVPATEHFRGPKKKEGVPFYNPVMGLSRDLSVLVLSHLVSQSPSRRWHVFDAMAALGARGLRMANEVPGIKVQLNDANPESIQQAQQNAKRLGLTNVDFRVGRLESHLGSERYDWVDLDPYGAPAGFLDVAMLSVVDQGILAVTATDLPTLVGVYPSVCQRRYNAKPLHGICKPEVATRILLGAIARSASRRDRGVVPLLAYAAQHFIRVYVRIEDGASAAERSLKHYGFIFVKPDGERGFSQEPRTDVEWAGPLWTGPLCDVELVSAIAGRAGEAWVSRGAAALLARLEAEKSSPPLYFEVDELTRSRIAHAPGLDEWVARLQGAGFVASRTHFSPRAVKTDATWTQAFAALAPPVKASGTRSR